VARTSVRSNDGVEAEAVRLFSVAGKIVSKIFDRIYQTNALRWRKFITHLRWRIYALTLCVFSCCI